MMSSIPRPLFSTFKNIGRNWFKRTKPDYIKAKPGLEFTVASYNVLADQLLREHPHLYLNNNTHEPWVFDWNYRKRNLLAEIAYSNVDILCLQEVQEEHYYNWFHPKLQEQGYCGVYKKRSGDKPDGCATFFKRDMFTMQSFELVDFYRPNSTLMDRNNVAIILILNPTSKGLANPSPICVGNTHLLFNKKRGDIKLAQLAHLFAEIDRCTRAATSNGKGGRSSTYRMPVIMCGDFNSTPYSPLYEFVTSGKLYFQGLQKASISGQGDSNSRGRYNVFGNQVFPSELGLTHTCEWDSHQPKSTSSHSGANNKTAVLDLTRGENNPEIPGVLSHGLDFRSCYMHHGLDGTAEVTTCHDRACFTVDYVFYTSGGSTPSTSCPGVSSMIDNRLWLSGVLSLLSENELNYMGKLPSREISSDHLLLMTSFVLT